MAFSPLSLPGSSGSHSCSWFRRLRSPSRRRLDGDPSVPSSSLGFHQEETLAKKILQRDESARSSCLSLSESDVVSEIACSKRECGLTSYECESRRRLSHRSFFVDNFPASSQLFSRFLIAEYLDLDEADLLASIERIEDSGCNCRLVCNRLELRNRRNNSCELAGSPFSQNSFSLQPQ